MRPTNLLDILEFLVRHGRRIALWAIGLAVLAYAGSYLIPAEYRASAVIFPPEEDELASALSSSRRTLGALGGLGRLGGQYFTQADVALATLRSRSVHERVVTRLGLQAIYEQDTLEQAIRVLRDRTTARIATDGTISVLVSDRDAKRSAQIANAFLDELDRSTREFRSARARRTREFLTQRVAQADSILRATELELAQYQGKRGTVVLTPEARGAAEAAAGLLAQKMAAEVELAILGTYAAPGNEEYRRLSTRVSELSKQIGELPTAQLGGSGLVRGVVVQQQLVAVLGTYLEEARIREVMDTPTIQVLDPAVPPERRAWPRRSLIAFAGLLLGAGIGVVRARGISPGPPTRD